MRSLVEIPERTVAPARPAAATNAEHTQTSANELSEAHDSGEPPSHDTASEDQDWWEGDQESTIAFPTGNWHDGTTKEAKAEGA